MSIGVPSITRYITQQRPGLVSIPASTCLGFRVLLRSYSWYPYTDTLLTVLVQITVETGTYHCSTNRLKVPSPAARSVRYSIHHVFFVSITALTIGFMQIVWIALAIPLP